LAAPQLWQRTTCRGAGPPSPKEERCARRHPNAATRPPTFRDPRRRRRRRRGLPETAYGGVPGGKFVPYRAGGARRTWAPLGGGTGRRRGVLAALSLGRPAGVCPSPEPAAAALPLAAPCARRAPAPAPTRPRRRRRASAGYTSSSSELMCKICCAASSGEAERPLTAAPGAPGPPPAPPSRAPRATRPDPELCSARGSEAHPPSLSIPSTQAVCGQGGHVEDRDAPKWVAGRSPSRH
jgi:hypothetical protein